jgi:DNA-binding NtrC family response regulator
VSQKSPNLRVLIVDAELLIRWFIDATLTARGHTVVLAPDGSAARQALADPAGPFDAVVLDCPLSESNDLDLLAHIRRVSPDTVVVVMSAFATAELREAALALGACAVVSKPFEMHDLEATLMKACDARHE